VYSDDIQKIKKDIIKNKEESELKIKQINEKLNGLGTSLENTKTDLAFLHKSKKHLTIEKEALEKELAAV
jgi:hypothetical protein